MPGFTKLKGSGGYVIATISDEQQKKADLDVGDLFLAPVGRLETHNILKYFCKNCNKEFELPPQIKFENPNEKVQENIILTEIGKYLCNSCNFVIGEYRNFEST